MSTRARKIFEEGELSPSERAVVTVEFADAADEDPEEVRGAWVKEAVARLEGVERGEVELVSWEEVQVNVRRALDET